MIYRSTLCAATVPLPMPVQVKQPIVNRVKRDNLTSSWANILCKFQWHINELALGVRVGPKLISPSPLSNAERLCSHQKRLAKNPLKKGQTFAKLEILLSQSLSSPFLLFIRDFSHALCNCAILGETSSCLVLLENSGKEKMAFKGKEC